MNQSQPGKPPSVQHPQNTAVAQMLAKYPPNTPLAEGVAKTNPAAAIFLGMWQGSIEFYGKVVDESSNAVAGAQVAFKWVEVPTETGNRTAWTESEANGMFSLHGQHGLSLSVSVSKDGYYASRRDNDTFNFGPLEGEPFAPDQAKPVIFTLRKKGTGESLVQTEFPPGMGQIAQLRHDRTPAEIDLIKGEKVSGESGQLKLEFWRDISNKQAKVFDWTLQISVPGGGLIQTTEEFAFQAPEKGYQPSIIIDMLATNQNWQGEVRNKYYVQLPDGKYGRIDLYLLPYNGVFTLQSAINPSGSQNLEPAN